MATKQQIIDAIDSKIKSEGNISAVDTNKILKDILEFSDKPATSINGFDFGNIDNPLRTEQGTSVKINFTGIEKLSCSLYLCVEPTLQDPQKEGQDNPEWLFIPIKEEEYEILLSFLPNINKKQMYLTFIVPFLKAENNIIKEDGTKGVTKEYVDVKTRATKSASDFPMMIIGVGLLRDRNDQTGVHIILPGLGHISTSMALSYKPNKFNYKMFSVEMRESLMKMMNSIIEDNDLIIEE